MQWLKQAKGIGSAENPASASFIASDVPVELDPSGLLTQPF
jgi:hypothetical protein